MLVFKSSSVQSAPDNRLQSEALEKTSSGNKKMASFCKKISRFLGSFNSQVAPGTKVHFNQKLNTRKLILSAKDMQPLAQPSQLGLGSPNGFIFSHHVIDEFTDEARALPISYAYEAKQIQSKWVLQELGYSVSLSACYAMLALDAHPINDVQGLLQTPTDVSDAFEILSSAGLSVEPLERNHLREDYFLADNLKRDVGESWISLITFVESHQGERPLIIDDYDSATGVLFIRDSLQGRSFSMHIDDFMTYNPRNEFLKVTKGYTQKEQKELKRFLNERDVTHIVHEIVNGALEHISNGGPIDREL